MKRALRVMLIVAVIVTGLTVIIAIPAIGIGMVKSCFFTATPEKAEASAQSTLPPPEVANQTDKIRQLEEKVKYLERIAALERTLAQEQEARLQAQIQAARISPTTVSSSTLATAPTTIPISTSRRRMSEEERLAIIDGDEELADAIERTKLSLAVMVSNTDRVPANVAAFRRHRIQSFKTGLARQQRQLAKRKSLLKE